ncbi:alpha,alpha-trehalase TreF [Caulobacter sp. NIBR2454]|uniref:alpha,alpha-trehalase TreF n=1 Tax=Caulobacter sp. NIBR2454 TaxID=3015996 RepID=UPI0022B6B06A|nr:alpha,alpha-trehalase TreF [Caulobacter sp. NIBR2454]
MLRFTVIAAAVLSLGTAQAQTATPADLYGELFHQVQMRRLFADGKTFVDATPKRPPAQIMAEYRAHARFSDAELKRFVTARFDVPSEAPPPPPSKARPPISQHIATLWPVLTRQPETPPVGSSALPLDKPYVVPGGRFREMYYWDSYFTMLGLAQDGRDDLIEAMTDDFGGLIDRYGRIPNGTRTYYLSRSQPPFFYLMVGLSDRSDPAVFKRRVDQMRREHAFWMHGEDGLKPGAASARVVRLPDGSILNRYWDDRDTPRDESWREDILTAREVNRPAAEVFRDLRAGAESGWDFSARWLADGKTLKTIETTAIVPVDLNSLMYGVERAIAEACDELKDRDCVRDFARRADDRRAAIDRWLWNPERGVYLDYQWRERRPTGIVSAAALYPLFTGAASQKQANVVAQVVWDQLLAPGGIRTTGQTTGQQWDAPNGWAPLQWVAVRGLRAYGEDALAEQIARRWLATVTREYQASGKMLEKYDIEEARPGGGGEYPLQDGFGWTNGVTQALLALYPAA